MKTLNALIALCAACFTVIIGVVTYYICRPEFEILPTPGEVHDVSVASPAAFFLLGMLCLALRKKKL